jgi:CRISPR-associated protein Cmr2
MSALLAFSLGPVQPFIAQARKTRDLWVGSYLLSALMRKGLDGYPGELLFPALDAPDGASQGGGQIADLPNKFVALHTTVAQAMDAAERMRGRIEDAWRALAAEVWDYLFQHEQDAGLRAIWERQTHPAALFEIYWAAVPLDENRAGGQDGVGGGYSEAYRRVQELLDARKRLRAFTASDEPGEKSTISGERQALYVIAEGERNEAQAARAFWLGLARRFHEAQISHLGQERLDAIDAIKRFAPLAGAKHPEDSAGTLAPLAPFPSTDALAAAPFLYKILQRLHDAQESGQQEGQEGLRELARAAEQWAECAEYEESASFTALPALDRLAPGGLARRLLHCAAEAVYPSSYTPRQLEDSGVGDTQIETLKEAGPKALSGLKRAAGDLGIARPSSYFAVVLLDGDHMGRLISRQRTSADHNRLSRALSTFAHDAPRRIVEGESSLGRVVYAGGDDVMALLPVTYAIETASRLRDAYSEALHGIAPDVTASAGIVFVHRKMPLGLALEAARAAEHAAKESYERNALSVSLLRRSGAITSVGAHWRYERGPGTAALDPLDPMRTILAVRDLMRDGDLSPKFAYILMEESPTLTALEQNARQTEIKRLLTRQWTGRQTTDDATEIKRAEIKRLASEMTALADAFDLALPANRRTGATGYELTEAGPRQGMVELSGWLLIAAFLARSDAGDDGGDED